MKTTVLASAISALALGLVSSAHADDLPDTFEIDVIFENLAEEEGAEDFQKRLQRSARRYCDGYAPGATRRAARDCERAVIAAVEEALEDMADERREVLALADGAS